MKIEQSSPENSFLQLHFPVNALHSPLGTSILIVQLFGHDKTFILQIDPVNP
jgi:hypothetical protein